MSVQGIDVSNWQGEIDWEKVAASGRSFAFIKASEDPNFIDGWFPRNWSECKRVGMTRAAYHFARPDESSPAESVAYFQKQIAAVGGLETGDIIALDLEAGSGDLLTWAAEWLDLAERVFKVRPVLYSGHWFMEPHHLENAGLAKYPLWLASYQEGAPPSPAGWPSLAFWQYSAHTRVPGVDGDCDVNVFLGDDLAALGLSLQPLTWTSTPAIPPEVVDPPPQELQHDNPTVVAALDALWLAAGSDIEKQRTIIAVKVAFKLQEAA